MGVTSTYLSSGTIHEYTGQVNFNISPHGKWRVWTLIKSADDASIAQAFLDKKLFDLYQMNVHTINSNIRLMLEFVPKNIPMDHQSARRDLLRFLTARKLPIIWKEGRHGYEITKSGTIHRKWKLNTQYTIPTRDIDV
jgi:hypothetical protein